MSKQIPLPTPLEAISVEWWNELRWKHGIGCFDLRAHGALLNVMNELDLCSEPSVRSCVDALRKFREARA